MTNTATFNNQMIAEDQARMEEEDISRIAKIFKAFRELHIDFFLLNVAVLVTVGIFLVVYSSIDPINATQLSSPTLSCNRL